MTFKERQIIIAEKPPVGYHYPWKEGEALLFLGEIVQMPGHCIVVNRSGLVYWGWHADNFREPREDEL